MVHGSARPRTGAQKWSGPSTCSLDKYLLTLYYVPAVVLDPGLSMAYEQHMDPPPHRLLRASSRRARSRGHQDHARFWSKRTLSERYHRESHWLGVEHRRNLIIITRILLDREGLAPLAEGRRWKGILPSLFLQECEVLFTIWGGKGPRSHETKH